VDALESIAAAVLYEGYVLWPYRRSARKNQQRWTFGGIYPRGFVESARSGDRWQVETQCLARGANPVVEVELRFLQVVARRVARVCSDGSLEFVDDLPVGVDGQRILAWDEALERRFLCPGSFVVAAAEEREAVDGGVIVRSSEHLQGLVDLRVDRLTESVSRVTVSLCNTTDWSGVDRDAAQRHGLMSAHFVLRVRDGAFVSLTDPPPDLAALAASCDNQGLWPVLVDDERTMLASPIILYDYPRVAPESPGLLFDSSEIDQLLILNTLTLSDAEKAEVRATDPRAREILDRAESLSAEDFARLHGTIRELHIPSPSTESFSSSSLVASSGSGAFAASASGLDGPTPESVVIGGVAVRQGSKVRVHPRGRADVFDLVLNGQIATVEAIEQDFDDRVQLAVTLDADPGRDLGTARMPGHRFFFGPDEVEPVP
jgi:hypothetical protein